MGCVKAGLSAVALLLFAAPALALEVGGHVDNFRLSDEGGQAHELYALANKRAVVIMTQGNGCPIVRNTLPALRELRAKYQSQGVEFLLLNSNLQDSRADIAKESAEFDYGIPVMADDTQLIGESLGETRTAEVFVIDPRGWTLRYHGPIDDRVTYERQKPVARHRYLDDALATLMAGQQVKVASIDAPGCLVNMPGRDAQTAHAKISYAKTIAPLLQEKCIACHREGGRAPQAMTSYVAVNALSSRIREVVRTRAMSSSPADPHFAVFNGDHSMSIEQMQTLVHWIEAGATRD